MVTVGSSGAVGGVWITGAASDVGAAALRLAVRRGVAFMVSAGSGVSGWMVLGRPRLRVAGLVRHVVVDFAAFLVGGIAWRDVA